MFFLIHCQRNKVPESRPGLARRALPRRVSFSAPPTPEVRGGESNRQAKAQGPAARLVPLGTPRQARWGWNLGRAARRGSGRHKSRSEQSRLWGRILAVNLAGAADFHFNGIYLHPILFHISFLKDRFVSASEARLIKIMLLLPRGLGPQGGADVLTQAGPGLVTFGFSRFLCSYSRITLRY
jgi:hypothetical protein